MASLPGYDAWKTAQPNDDHLAECENNWQRWSDSPDWNGEPDCICFDLELDAELAAAEAKLDDDWPDYEEAL